MHRSARRQGRWSSHGLAVALVGAWLYAPSPAAAYTPPVDGQALAVEWLDTFRPELPSPHHAVASGAEGEASYTYPLTLPPALLAPHLALVYDSRHGVDRDMAYGWHLSGLAAITRPNDLQAFQEGELHYVSPESGGVLRPGGVGEWRLSTTSGGETNLAYEETTDTWTAASTIEGTWTLAAADAGASHGTNTSLWRGTRYSDPSGNCFDATYDSQGRIETIEYGGNWVTEDAHTVRVSFSYGSLVPVHTNARGGFIDELEGSLNYISIETWADGASGWADARAYELDVSRSEGVTRLDDIIAQGVTDGDAWHSEPAVNFTYSDFTGASAPERDNETTYPFADLGRTVTRDGIGDEDAPSGSIYDCDAATLPARVESTLIDLNGDGLPDYVEADGTGNWTVYYQLVNATTGAHTWDTAGTTYTGLTDWIGGFYTSGDYTNQLVRLTDLDNDGFQDIIDTRPLTGCGGSTGLWGVRYGNGDGFDAMVPEAAPLPYIERRNAAIDSDLPGIEATLVDVNGDGFLDVVRLAPTSDQLEVWLHTGTRGGGWATSAETQIAPWTVDLGMSTEGMSGLSYHHPEFPPDGGQMTDIADWGGFQDVNGDGLMDFVLAAFAGAVVPSTSVLADGLWSVYLGNGSGYEPRRTWSNGPLTILWQYVGDVGTPKVEEEGLQDFDGDGLLDEVDVFGSASEWRPNLGDGFAGTPQSLPSWTALGPEIKTVEGVPCSSDGCTDYVHRTVVSHRDMDHDGALDVVNLEVSPSVTYGAYPRPNILISVDTGTGLVSDLTYAPSCEVEPSGDPSMPQHLHAALDLVGSIQTTDTVSGRSATSSYDYTFGWQVSGAFRGFGQREVTEETSELRWRKQDDVYVLDLDDTPLWSPLLALSYVYSDACLRSVPALARCATATPQLRIAQSFFYDDFGSHRLLSHYAETDDGDEVPAETTKSFSVDYDYDQWGDPTLIEHDGGPDGTSAAKSIEIRYIEEGASPPTMVRPSDEIVSGWDALAGVWRQERWTQYWYDDLGGSGLTEGLLTRVDDLAWLAEDGQTPSGGGAVTTEYERDDRGQVTTVTEQPQGAAAMTTLTWTFGDAVLESETTPTRAVESVVDARGRTTGAIDLDNGTEETTEFDAFDRPIAHWVIDAAGGSHVTSTQAYDHSSVPFHESTSLYASGGTLESIAYRVLDGQGLATQTWQENAAGSYDVTDIHHDLWGATLATTRAHPQASFAWSGYNGSGGHQSWYDGLGVARATSRDLGGGGLLLTQAHPWLLSSTDESGYCTDLAQDAYGRLVRVSQGQQGVASQTATYQYDPLDRLVRYTDAIGNAYDDVYDGAGRLRRVRGVDIGQVSYGYSGADRTSRTDTAGDSAAWSYDLTHRPLTLAVSDPILGTANYAWTWDTAWSGGIASSTDPAGTETTLYDTLGRTHVLGRTWAGGLSATYHLDRDLQGRVTSTLTPGGFTLGTNYAHGWPVDLTQSGVTIATLGYDTQGEPAQLVAPSAGLQINWTYATPGLPSLIHFHQGTTHVERDYTWYADGLMHTVNDLAGATTYAYDAQQRLASSTGPRTESWTWDLAGNPQAIHTYAPSHSWTYTRGAGSEMASRQDGATLETFTWDLAGRLSHWVNGPVNKHYEYDGLGRLRRASTNGMVQLVVEYDADGAITRRTNGNPALPSAIVSSQFHAWSYRSNVAQAREELTLAGIPVGDLDGSALRWYFTEYGGHVATVTSNVGTVLGQRTLAAFGATINRTGFPPAFRDLHGELQDPATDLYLVGPRAFIPDSGQWLQPDPMLLNGLRGGNLADPQALHPYRYGRNTPTTWGDRTGKNPLLLLGAAEVAVDAAVAGGVAYEVATSPEGELATEELEAELGPLVTELEGDLSEAGTAIGEETKDVVQAVGDRIADIVEVVEGGGAPTEQTTEGSDPKGGQSTRFIVEPNGTVVDLDATPRGSYEQPGGGRTDVLQAEDHGAGLSHTHDPSLNTNPRTGQTFINGQQQPGRPVSPEDVANITSGDAPPSPPKGR